MKTIFIFCLLIINVSINAQTGGKVLWKFKADDSYIQGRPGIGADGTIYALGINGHLYALTPQGVLKWTYRVLQASVQSVSVGSNGTIYFAGLNSIYAINPNGTLKWQVTNRQGGLFDVGPTVGPDGNIYAVADNQTDSGLSAISITPAGKIRWNKSGYIHGNGTAGQTKEVIFGGGKLYFCLNRIDAISGLHALNMSTGERIWTQPGDRQPAISNDEKIYTISAFLSGSYAEISAYDLNGNLLKKYFGNGTRDLTSPDVGSDGTFYVGTNYQYLVGENPNGTQKFSLTGKPYIQSPVINNANTLVAVCGSQSFAPGYVAAATIAGKIKWSVLLSLGGGEYATPLSKPKFSNDDAALYVGTALTNSTSTCYLYAISTGTGAVEKAGNAVAEIKSSTNKNESIIKLYPNPAKDNLRVMFNAGVQSVYDLTIANTQAAIVLHQSITAAKGNNNFNMNISSLVAGNYVLTLKSGNKLMTEKFIKH